MRRALVDVERRDPSQPWSTRLQKWVVFSVGLALVGLFSDVIAGLVLTNGARPVDVLGRGELYMASVGMLFSSAGELLYDRTRTDMAGSWQITVAVFTMMFALCPASLFGLAKANKSDPTDVMTFSITFAALSLVWGIVLVFITDMGRRRAGKP